MKNLLNVTLLSSIFLISACGGGGGGGSSSNSSGGGGNTGGTSNQAVINSFTTDQTSIVAGNSITLSWSSSYSTSCSASGSWDGSKATSGTEVLLMSDVGTFEYLLICSNSSGSSAQNLFLLKLQKILLEVVTLMIRTSHHTAEQQQIAGQIIG